MASKTCKICKDEKDTSLFPKRRRICKECYYKEKRAYVARIKARETLDDTKKRVGFNEEQVEIIRKYRAVGLSYAKIQKLLNVPYYRVFEFKTHFN